MSFAEELAGIDTDKISDVYEDLIANPDRAGDGELDDFVFLQAEVIRSDSTFPVFATIMKRFKEQIPLLLELGMTEEQLKGMMGGIYITQVVLSSYAEMEVPDSLPPPTAV